ncbi:MAG: hypothetical protein HOO92_01510 [Methylococcaceae bacterium]|nr:hypothetical protein [Methylococcaceae bacterium]
MEPEPDLIKMRDEIFRKIGRNLLNFQKIEFMLKHLITYGRISGYMSELKENQERRAATVHKQTMGNLVGQFIDNTLLGLDDSSRLITEPKEPYLSFSFTVSADADFYERKKQGLKSLVDDRNDMIHHLLPRFNSDSIESCLEIGKYLDEQRERLIPEYDHLQSLIKSLNINIEFLKSEEGIKQVSSQLELSFLQNSPLVLLLLNISIQQPRSDGWTLLSNAGQQIRHILPEELVRLKSGYRCKNIKELLKASELFDINEEPTDKGGVRVLYRPKPELGYGAFNRVLNSLLVTSRRTARADGWSLLNTAGQEIEQFLAEDLALVKEKWGYVSLKEFIMESGLFDVVEEQVDKNNICELFRPKAEFVPH